MKAPIIKIREVECKSAIGKCGFPGGGWVINPYVGCAHGCVYCYARFIKRFTGHTQPWGTFVDVRVNIAQVLRKQLTSPKYKKGTIYIGTVTDPYQPIEKEYELTREIIFILKDYKAPVSILTKSDLVLRDLDLLKEFKDIDINFTINTLDSKWNRLVEPYSPTVEQRFKAIRKLASAGITVFTMMGPLWPIFTDPEVLFSKFKEVGVSRVFAESFNTVGGNFVGVEKVLEEKYPQFLPQIKETLFDKEKFHEFYHQADKNLKRLSKKYNLPITSYFGSAHSGKFK